MKSRWEGGPKVASTNKLESEREEKGDYGRLKIDPIKVIASSPALSVSLSNSYIFIRAANTA